jgi:hypothetical protein
MKTIARVSAKPSLIHKSLPQIAQAISSLIGGSVMPSKCSIERTVDGKAAV